ncbi:citrate synthase family protein [Leptospira adleri]|uniref:citrate synthase (unknown stereospecificity) n=1 Tax=Leptospira adleri TaxID=2023186 RepID=A0A2M9YLZ7_9LEPT|nr:citrate synthase family protein [Leptospira adleri]PJZ52559.1 citrate synthase [Leptospira adleri]PJZ60954.1 citrate synthase [Leptospira adleri]
MKTPVKKPFLSAFEAAQELNVEVETIYAYVSRGLLHSESSGSKDRSKRYRREEIERLLLQREEKQNPGKTARAALSFGQPVLESSVSLIEENAIYYRGRNVDDLAENSNFETVARILWDSDESSCFDEEWPCLNEDCLKILPILSDRPLIDLCRILLGVSEYEDTNSLLKNPEALCKTGTRIVRLLALFASKSKRGKGSIAETLWISWKESAGGKKAALPVRDTSKNRIFSNEDKKAIRLIDASLILSADHELNASSFTTRCVASTDASLYQAVIGGLAALSGNRHGLLTEKAIELIESASARKKEERLFLTERLRMGEKIPGFGHPFYREGDPRGKKLLELSENLFPKNKELIFAKNLIEEATSLLGDYPTIDMGLAAVSRTLGLPKGAGLALFAIGRCAGWIAHAMEQYQTDQLIRPRARYVGLAPQR